MNTRITTVKNILFATWEGGGNVAPALTVARKLAQRGHRVRFMCDTSAREEAAASGVEFRAWQTAPNRPDRTPASCPVRDWEAKDPQEGSQRLMDEIMVGPALRYAQDLLAELQREPADLVVSSDMLLGVMAACESRGQPLALLAANLCFYPLPQVPTFGPGLPPARNEAEAALHAAINAENIRMFDLGLATLNEARGQLGLKPLDHVSDQVDAAALFLLGTSESFDFVTGKLPPKLRYVGPQLDEPAWAEPWVSPWEKRDRRKLVLVGFSTTFQNHARALQAVVDACAPLPVRALVTLGQIHPEELVPAANTRLVASAPHDAVMRQAAVVVTHGGHGTVMRALSHHLPLLIMPHGRDQNENAIRVTERGAGICLPPDAESSQIEDALRRLIEDPSFTEAATRLGLAINEDIEASPVVALLENLASRPKRGMRLAG